MSLSARLARIETRHAAEVQHFEIIAADEADAKDQFLHKVLFGARPDPYIVHFTVGGRQFDESGEQLAHEDWLELLS